MPPLRILICDDMFLVRKRLKESLDLCGKFEILEAADGQEAVELYKQHLPDLVFLDIVMPVLDGIGALKEMQHSGHQALVVMMTSTGTQAYVKKALEAGAKGFIQKPWEYQRIASIIDNLVKTKQSEIEGQSQGEAEAEGESQSESEIEGTS